MPGESRKQLNPRFDERSAEFRQFVLQGVHLGYGRCLNARAPCEASYHSSGRRSSDCASQADQRHRDLRLSHPPPSARATAISTIVAAVQSR